MKPSTPEQENIIQLFNTRDESRWELAFMLTKENWSELYLKIKKDSIDGIHPLKILMNKEVTSSILFPSYGSLWRQLFYGNLLKLVPTWENKTL